MILVLGKGISGKGITRLLKKEDIRYDYLNDYEVKKMDYDLVIKSPGIPYSNKIIRQAIKKKIPVITDIELVYHLSKKEFIAVTGTNGKTTTVSILSKLLKMKPSGNIGYSVCDYIIDYPKNKYCLCELSSFQLKGIKDFRPNVAVILNLEKAHLDYHENISDYHDSKMNILKNMNGNDFVIYNYDDEVISKYVKDISVNKISFSLCNNKANCYIVENYVYYNNRKILSISNLKLKGNQYYYDILASICVSKVLKVKRYVKKIIKFKGINYRMTYIKKNIFNDAKSTNPLSTLGAIKNFNDCILICGGKNRGEDLSVLKSELYRLKKVYCYGESKSNIKDFMESNLINCEEFQTLKEAVYKLKKDKIKGTILYSPMMASLDQYSSYKERGKEFNTYF